MKLVRYAALVIALLTSTASIAKADTITSLDAVYNQIAQAKTVVVSAYTLSPRSTMLRVLESAARRGTHVELVLTGDGLGYAVRDNQQIIQTEHAFHVELSRGPLHLKAVVVNGGAGGVFLSDRNWAKNSVVVALPSSYALAVDRAMIGDPHDDGALTLTKGSSLLREAALINQARSSVDFESESFGADNPVYAALQAALARGVHVSITVAQNEYSSTPSERALLNDLGRHGAKLFESDENEKLLSIDGGRIGWIGSSNATSGVQNQIDWGYTTTDRTLIETIVQHLNG